MPCGLTKTSITKGPYPQSRGRLFIILSFFVQELHPFRILTQASRTFTTALDSAYIGWFDPILHVFDVFL